MMSALQSFFENVAKKSTIWMGSSIAFTLAIGLVTVWACFGPFYEWSDSHSLFINSVTTIITFLMVFLIQRTQNKDSTAIQLKLNEILASIEGASNHLLNIEDLSEKEIEALKKRYKSLAHKTKQEINRTTKHSIEEIDD